MPLRLSTPSGPLFKARRPKPLRCKTAFSSIASPSGTPRASPTVRVGRLPATLRRALVRLAPKRAEAAAAKKGSPPKTRRSAVLGGGVAAAGTPKGVRRDAAATAAAAAAKPHAKNQRAEATPARAEKTPAAPASANEQRAAKKQRSEDPPAREPGHSAPSASAARAASRKPGVAPQGGSGAHQSRAASAPEGGGAQQAKPQQAKLQQARTPDAAPVSRGSWAPGSWREDGQAQAAGGRAQGGRAPLTPLTPSQAARSPQPGTAAGSRAQSGPKQGGAPGSSQGGARRPPGGGSAAGKPQQGKLQPLEPPRGKAAAGAGFVSKCDKCDGAHATAACPHFRKSRDAHPDAQRRAGGGLGGLGGGVPLRLRRGRIVGQPGDGSCLFHSLRFGLAKGGGGGHLPTTQGLRRELAQWVAQNAQRRIAETPLAMWVKWDSGQTAQSCADPGSHPSSLALALALARTLTLTLPSTLTSYAARMARGGWGGGIEMAACAHLKHVNVWVYEANKRQASKP